MTINREKEKTRKNATLSPINTFFLCVKVRKGRIFFVFMEKSSIFAVNKK